MLGFCIKSLLSYAVLSVLSSVAIIFMEKRERAGWFTFIVFMLSGVCLCFVDHPYGVVGWSAVCDFVISLSYLLTYFFVSRVVRGYTICPSGTCMCVCFIFARASIRLYIYPPDCLKSCPLLDLHVLKFHVPIDILLLLGVVNGRISLCFRIFSVFSEWVMHLSAVAKFSEAYNYETAFYKQPVCLWMHS